jgi:hypothetical protein
MLSARCSSMICSSSWVVRVGKCCVNAECTVPGAWPVKGYPAQLWFQLLLVVVVACLLPSVKKQPIWQLHLLPNRGRAQPRVTGHSKNARTHLSYRC